MSIVAGGKQIRMCGVVASLGRGQSFCRWPSSQLRYCIRDQHPRVSPEIWEGEIEWALSHWSKTFVLDFERIDEPNRAHLLFTVANLGGQGGVLAQAGLVPCGVRRNDDFQSKIEVDSLDNFGVEDRTSVAMQFDLGEVLTHELGHSFGQGHEERRGVLALMNPQYNPRISGLQKTDIANFSQPGWYELRKSGGPKPPAPEPPTALGAMGSRALKAGQVFTAKKRAWVVEEL